jgi:hypothetical protein
MLRWLLCLFFAPCALSALNTTQQVQPFVASLASELQRVLPDGIVVAEPSTIEHISKNVSALLPTDVSNSTVLGLLSALGSAEPNGIISCFLGWMTSATARDIDIFFDLLLTPLGFGVWALGTLEVFCDGSVLECLALAPLAAIVGALAAIVVDLVTVPLDTSIGALVLCILNIKPPGTAAVDSFKALAKDKKRISEVLSQSPSLKGADLAQLLQKGHGFEAGFKVGSILKEAWSKEMVQVPAVVV